MDRAARVLGDGAGELGLGLVLGDDIDLGQQLLRRQHGVDIGDMEGAARKARVARVALLRAPLQDRDLGAFLCGGNAGGKAGEAASDNDDIPCGAIRQYALAHPVTSLKTTSVAVSAAIIPIVTALERPPTYPRLPPPSSPPVVPPAA